MRRVRLLLVALLTGTATVYSQSVADRTVFFNLSDTGVSKPITWGLDLAWLNQENIQRGIAFMGKEQVDVIRSSFTPTAPLLDGELAEAELGRLNERLDIIDLLDPHTVVALNCDHPSVDPWYAEDVTRWASLIDVTTRLHQEHGRTVVSVAPFNEPDYGWGQGSIDDFYTIAGELKQNPRFENIRISGGNTLNPDVALDWYNTLKDRLDEGNTHQLAGSFDSYAGFFEEVRANGDHATNDELHNVMEAMVGVEYGLQTGIWWGTAEYARSEFVKASDGRRLGYAEHRPNWTSASVYRHPGGKVQAFIGSSERQAVTTTYRFVSKDRDVYFDGHGPGREYIVEIPGGTGYQEGQTNAERVVNISWGDDIQPVVNGRYVLVNRNSGKVMEVANGSYTAGANVRQVTYSGEAYQQWNVKPVSPRIGGDFSYFTVTAAHSNQAMDVYNWALHDGGNVVVWHDTRGGNQQWFLEYAGEGWFYIRSRHSAKCLEVFNFSETEGANVSQREKHGGENQQWRLIPAGAEVEFEAPAAPADLSATGRSASILLEWAANSEDDLAGYMVFRAQAPGGPYQTIARDISGNAYVDNRVMAGNEYYYVVRAMDSSLNRSSYSNEVSATLSGQKGKILHLDFEENTLDQTEHLNHGTSYEDISYTVSGDSSGAIDFNGTSGYVQLSPTVSNHATLTIATWVYWNGGASWQHIFDFGNNAQEYMFLSPRMRFAIKSGGDEQRVSAPGLPEKEWTHVAVTLSSDSVRIFVNGEMVSHSEEVTLRPLDFKPILNYIGRNQNYTPLFNGYLDDFIMYNYALSPGEVAELYQDKGHGNPAGNQAAIGAAHLKAWPVPADKTLYIESRSGAGDRAVSLGVYDLQGRKVMARKVQNGQQLKIDVSEWPSGTYLLVLDQDGEILQKKFMVNH